MITFSDDFGENPKTLCDWVKNFRIKKIQMKRKSRGGDLRVCAILSTALLSAEHELRRKQQERFNRWLEMQAKLEASKKNALKSSCHQQSVVINNEFDFATSTTSDGYVKTNEFINVATTTEERQRRDEITNLWKYELSGLDEFMRNISGGGSNSSSGSYSETCSKSNNNNSSYSSSNAIQVAS